jgi:hypothetical protein
VCSRRSTATAGRRHGPSFLHLVKASVSLIICPRTSSGCERRTDDEIRSASVRHGSESDEIRGPTTSVRSSGGAAKTRRSSMVNSLSIFMTGTAPGRRSARQQHSGDPATRRNRPSAIRMPGQRSTRAPYNISTVNDRGVSPFPNSDCRDGRKTVGIDLGTAHGCRGPGAGPRRVRVGRPALPGSRAGTRSRGKNSCDVVAASSGTSPDMAADCRNQPPHRPPL